MDYTKIENEVKDYVLSMLKHAEAYEVGSKERLSLRALAFGCLDFACGHLLPADNDNLADWWENEIWGKFTYGIDN